MSTTNIMIVGVGGQGSLLASKILGKAALSCGYDVKVSEVHGMSQRGGSVVTYVKYGDSVSSPVICRGEADFILSFEQLEAYRWLPYLKKGGTIVTGTQKISPMPVITGVKEYPDDIVEKIKEAGVSVYAADALDLADKAGNQKTANVVLLGLLSRYLGIDKDIVLDALRSSVPEKFLDVNLKAFELGHSFGL